MDIHYHCAMDLIRQMGDICPTCKTEYKKNEKIKLIGMYSTKPDNEIYFPHLGIFPIPLFSGKYIHTNHIFEQIKLSIIYLQTQNLLKLLFGLNEEQKTEIKNQLCDYLKDPCNGIGKIVNNKFMLISNMCSNAPREYNLKEYIFIERLINRILFKQD
jgi:hypothetical protein